MICKQGIYHGSHSHDPEEEIGNKCRPITEIQHANCESTKDDSEIEPREKGSLVGEENFRLDAGGEGDLLAWMMVVS
jgi:hypothetical protein